MGIVSNSYTMPKSYLGKFSLMLVKSTEGRMLGTSQDGRTVFLSSIPHVSLTGKEIFSKLPKRLQNQNYQQKFLQYFVDHKACPSNEQKHAALHLCSFLFLSTYN